MCAARRAVDPRGGAAGVVFLFPNRQAGLRFVDDVAARLERRPPVFRGDTHPHREFAKLQVAGAMHGHGSDERKLCTGIGEDFLALGFGERRIGLVFEREDGLTLVAVTHPAFEGHARTRSRVGERALAGGGVDGDGGKAEAHNTAG